MAVSGARPSARDPQPSGSTERRRRNVVAEHKRGSFAMSFSHNPQGLGVGPGALFSSSAWWPSLDVYESDSAYIIIVEVGGIAEDAVQVEVTGSQVRIAGSRSSPACRMEAELNSVHHREIDHGEFERRVVLPGPIDPDAIEASLSQGFLEVTLPKRPEGSRPSVRCIEVR